MKSGKTSLEDGNFVKSWNLFEAAFKHHIQEVVLTINQQVRSVQRSQVPTVLGSGSSCRHRYIEMGMNNNDVHLTSRPYESQLARRRTRKQPVFRLTAEVMPRSVRGPASQSTSFHHISGRSPWRGQNVCSRSPAAVCCQRFR